MPTALHRTTLELVRSVDQARLDPVEWLIDPDLRNVAGVPQRYWKLSGDVVSAMDAAERAARDAEIAATEKAARETAARGQYDADALIRALALVLLDEINTLRQRASLQARTAEQLRTAIAAKLQEIA